MRLFIAAAFALWASTLSAAGDAGDKPKSDHVRIQGTWKVVSSEEAGAAQQFPNKPRFVIKEDTLTVKPIQGEPMTLKYQLDPAKQPPAIDITHQIDPGKPILQRGIYSLEGDELKLCIAGSGQPRPEKFDSKAGVLLNLKRVP